MRREPIPKQHRREMSPTLNFDIRDPDQKECLHWIRSARHGEMTKRIMELLLLGFETRKAQNRKDSGR